MILYIIFLFKKKSEMLKKATDEKFIRNHFVNQSILNQIIQHKWITPATTVNDRGG